MSEGFELSLKNKIVRMCLWIMIPATIIGISLILFTDLPSIIPSLILTVAWVIFFIWLYFYKRKEKEQEVGHS